MVLQLAVQDVSERKRLRAHEALRPSQAVPRVAFASLQLSGAVGRAGRAGSRPRHASIREAWRTRVAGEGFAVILIDRYGYEDNGAAIAAALLRVTGDGHVIAQTERYLALDIRGSPARARVRAGRQRACRREARRDRQRSPATSCRYGAGRSDVVA